MTESTVLSSSCLPGLNPDPKSLDKMLQDAPGQLNFTHFLTLFGEKLHGKAVVSD